jgi:hypothetical protein
METEQLTISDLDPETRPFVKPAQLPALGFGSLKAIYRAIANEEIPALRQGHRLLVPTAWVRRVLQVDDSAA